MSLLVHVYLALLNVHCMSLSFLSYFHLSAYRKCSKKTAMKAVVSLMIIRSVRKGLRIVTMRVFVNQMLLMRAGDVERNPGPCENDE